MGEFKYTDNVTDLSEEQGARAGFQFEFSCERCGDRWVSEFKPWRAGQAAEWLDRAAGFLGGLGGVADAVSGGSEASFGVQRDKEMKAAIEEIERRFNRCPRCTNMVCDTCWNPEAGLCLECAPSAEVEVEAAYASGKVYAVGEKAALHGIREGKQMDVKRRRQLVCPDCGAETEGSKFCAECGAQLAKQSFCTDCGTEMSADAKFCPECGTKKE